MNDTEYKQTIDLIIYLCSCAINKTKVDIKRIENINIDNIYVASKKHMMSSMIGQILINNGVYSEKFKQSVALSERKSIILENDYSEIISVFEIEKIWYMPLKGFVLKDYYPSFSMREMADIDILFDATRADDVKEIMLKHGFKAKSFGEKNDDDYVKPPVSNIELHRSLFGSVHDIRWYEYYKSIQEKLLKDSDNGFGYHFNADDFYVFMIAHEFKHFSSCGTGLRSLLDTYVYLTSNNLDMKYVSEEIEKLGLSNFEKMNRSLAMDLFSGKDLTDDEQEMFNYIIDSGVYGTFQNYLEHRINKDGGKRAYVFSRIFGPANRSDPYRMKFEKKYAFFYKYPVMLPFLPLYRLFGALKNSPKRIINEVKAINRQKK